jgi:hypothetical protein
LDGLAGPFAGGGDSQSFNLGKNLAIRSGVGGLLQLLG